MIEKLLGTLMQESALNKRPEPFMDGFIIKYMNILSYSYATHLLAKMQKP